MKRYYTIRNPFYPSFKTLRKRWMKRERQREVSRENMRMAESLVAAVLFAISYHNNHNQN